jgi:hypothetical protein
MLLIAAAWLSPAAADDDFAYGRRLFLDKAECSFCHGWAGDGSGHPKSPGRAANLRKSQLGRDALVTVILCGIPGTAMPHFDELAYTDQRCYGMTEAELGARTPTLPPSTTLQRREASAPTRAPATIILLRTAARISESGLPVVGVRPCDSAEGDSSMLRWAVPAFA